MPFKVVDLFSGAGGMSYGFKSHPAFGVVFAVDAEAGKPSSGIGALDCNASYEANIGVSVRGANLTTYSPEQLLKDSGLRPGDVSVLISCAPCTGFSRTLNANHLRDDPRNNLVERTGEFVKTLRPQILLMENARELLNGRFDGHFSRLRETLVRCGYKVEADIHLLNKFGLPQTRERALVIAVADNETPRTLDDLWQGHNVKAEATWVERAIRDLPGIDAGKEHPAVDNHISPGFSDPITEARICAIPHDGGSWADLIGTEYEKTLLTPAMERYAAARDFGSHPDVYGRLWWKRPCVTIKRECAHIGNGRFSHPVQDRLCTVRELALLNGFPIDYKFVSTSIANRYRHIGDAVPPLVSYQLAHVCNWILTGKRPNLSDCVLQGTSLRRSDIENQVVTAIGPLFATVTA